MVVGYGYLRWLVSDIVRGVGIYGGRVVRSRLCNALGVAVRIGIRRERMSELQAVKVQKKRESKPGTQRIMVTLGEADWKALVTEAEAQLREPNNLLTFLLRNQIQNLIERE